MTTGLVFAMSECENQPTTITPTAYCIMLEIRVCMPLLLVLPLPVDTQVLLEQNSIGNRYLATFDGGHIVAKVKSHSGANTKT